MKRITPEVITREMLPSGYIFVFGSNEAGLHGAGAAHFAYSELGARWKQGFGMSGRTFAIPTKDWDVRTLSIEDIQFYVGSFLRFTQCPNVMNHALKFYVTKIGCGLAGYSSEEIAPLFKPAIDLENIYLPEDFINIINSNTDERYTTTSFYSGET